MRKIFAITMWSGGQPAKKWQTYEKPELLAHGTGIRFTCRYTKLAVELIGSVSIEEYESGKDEIEEIKENRSPELVDGPSNWSPDDNGTERLF